MFQAKIRLAEDEVAAVTTLIQGRLSDMLDLSAQLKQAHWNVKGMAFHQLHSLFDALFSDVESHVDLLAERLVTLGGIADGRVQSTSNNSTLESYPLGAASGEEHLRAISSALTRVADYLREGIDNITSLGDAGTADLFTEISVHLSFADPIYCRNTRHSTGSFGAVSFHRPLDARDRNRRLSVSIAQGN